MDKCREEFEKQWNTTWVRWKDMGVAWKWWALAWKAAAEQPGRLQWIPVGEQLPEEAAPVLVPYYPIPIAAYWDRGPDLEVRWWKFGVPNEPIETRYWMPLPSQSAIK